MTEIKDKVITKDAFALPYTIIKAKNQPTKGAIVYIHGGGLMFGKANDLSPQYIDILTEHYDLIQLSYRLVPEVSLDCIIVIESHHLMRFNHNILISLFLPLADHQVHI